ncbi:SH3 domain-containing protein [Devosia sp. 63-57]|uniref:SH3 domain-containing protein n=1 Tax=Devosia sp. 63-57 TaxID=1895751 RepID=UPI000B257AF3|nr:SH3 domain-containing protein [Devosia sp. 63-57]
MSITSIRRAFLPATLTTLVALMLSLLPASAQDARTVDVRFPRGASGTTLSDTIEGYQTIDYRIGVSAGQTMSVQLDTNNSSNYFNISAPGASDALFNGSISGNSTNLRLTSSGNYTISVYLMRNAARRNEAADFDLTISVDGSAAQAPRPTTLPSGPVAPVSVGSGPEYWQVEGLGSDTLNVRSGPSTGNPVIGTVRDGDTLRNFGCTTSGSTRWCQVETPRGQRGWVAGRYLHESFGQPTSLPTVVRPRSQPQPVPSNPTPSAVSNADMPRFCTGEASARFGVRPAEITVNSVLSLPGNYVVQGWFDQADGSTQFFNCYFALDGSFQSVR